MSQAQANTQSARVQLANAVPSQVGHEAPTSSSLAQVNPFNSSAREAFYLYLDTRKDQARERITTSEKRRYVKWLTEAVAERLGPAEGKKRAWIGADFAYDQGKLWKLLGRLFKQRREVIIEDLIFDTIVTIHNSLGHAGQNATCNKIGSEYYGIAHAETQYLVKLCEICHRKVHSKSKGPLKSIETSRLFERVQIDLIDMTS